MSDKTINTADFRTITDLGRLTIEDRGEPALGFGLVLKLYFERAHEAEVRMAMVDMIADYRETFGAQITHLMPYSGARLKKIGTSDVIGLFRARVEELARPEETEGFDAELYGFAEGEDVDEPTPWHIGALASPPLNTRRLKNPHNAMGWIEAYCPLVWAEADFALAAQAFRRWVALARPIHGTFGLGLVMNEGAARMPYMGTAFPFLKRFAGFEFPDKGLWKVQSEDAETPVIRSTNWLTCIDHRRVDALGGMAALGARLSEGCTLEAYGGGAILQAGPQPGLGDSNSGIGLPAYGVVAKALKPLRFAAFGRKGLFRGLPDPLDDRDETLAWLARFDG